MARKSYKDQNGGHLSRRPPDQLGRIAAAMWRKLVPVLEQSGRVERVDAALVEMYCSQYEIYRKAYAHIQGKGQVSEIYRTVVSPTGEVVGKDFVGFKRNPSTLIYSDSLAKLTKVGAELGLSPRSRADLMQIAIEDDGDKDSMADQMQKFFNGDDKNAD
jgi:P27 family predicted phage terminase small subunit